MSRRGIIVLSIVIGSLCCFFLGAYVGETANPFTRQIVEDAEKVIGLHFSEAKQDSMLDGLNDQLHNYENIRKVSLPNSIPPAMLFNPIPLGWKPNPERKPFRMSDYRSVSMPRHVEDLAFATVGELSQLVKSRKVTSLQLTQMYLDRLKKFAPKLLCVVTLTEEIALREAKKADEEIASGNYRGPLHGIPYGIKDLLSTKGVRTTWGSVPFKDQIIDEDATVVRRLQDAGAVMVAKLTMGELAWGDVWFGGTTKNPWNIEKGSSGSSAGPASATSAGLVGFSIGTETWGSIVSPSTVCGTTGLRPTYGRVSRTGAMALSWSMDKIGPICRSVEDCAIVFNAIVGPDGKDQTLIDAPFNYSPEIDLSSLRVGYLKSDFDSVKSNKENNEAAFTALRSLGARLLPVSLPHFPVNDLSIILSAEAGAAFDDLTRSAKEDLLVRQIKDAWPNVFRLSRFIPAVEYLQANRIRFQLIQEMAKTMEDVDLYVAPSFEGDNLLLTNLTGHPCVVVQNGFSKEGTPTSITFIGRLFDEATILAVAKKYQDATGFHLKHPPMDWKH